MGGCVSSYARDQELKRNSTKSCSSSAFGDCYLTNLPVDVLYTIKGLLPPRSYRALLQLRSSELHAALHTTTQNCKLLTSHTLATHSSSQRGVRPQAFTKALRRCSNLKVLNLTPCSKQLTASFLVDLLGSLSTYQLEHITTLVMGSDNVPGAAPVTALRMLPNLSNLECQLGSATFGSLDTLEAILDSSKHLTRATFFPPTCELYPLLCDAMLKVMTEHCPTQLLVDLHRWRATTLQLRAQPAAFNNIVSLQIRCTCDSLSGTEGLLPHLESVQLQCCDTITLETLSHSFVATAKNLRILHACWLDVSGPTAWLSNLTNVEVLVLSHAKLPPGDTTQFPALQSALPRLATLVLDMCTGVPESALYPALPPQQPPTRTPPANPPTLKTLAISTHWGTGTRPACTTIHRWLQALKELPSPLPPFYALSSLYLHFNDTDVEADQALPHLGALCRLPHLHTLQLSTTRVRSVDSKMILPVHLDGIRQLRSAPQLRDLRVLCGWLTPEVLACIPPALPHLTHLSFVAGPDAFFIRRYYHILHAQRPDLTYGITFVVSHRDIALHSGPYGQLLELPAVTDVNAVLLESRVAEHIVPHVLKNTSVARADFVLPRGPADERADFVADKIVAPLEGAGVQVSIGWHAGCYQAWSRALGDPGVVRNAERHVEHRDWRTLQL